MDSEFIKKYISKKGYKKDSPHKDRPFNYIQSPYITMKDVEHPVLGIDDMGNVQFMLPNIDYTFLGNNVLEIPIKQDGGNINKLEGDIISKILMNRNRNKDFVKRANAIGQYPNSNMFTVPGQEFGERSSHLMEWGEDDTGQAWMYPTIMNERNEAVKVPNQYADYISSEGYKKAAGMKEYQQGSNVNKWTIMDDADRTLLTDEHVLTEGVSFDLLKKKTEVLENDNIVKEEISNFEKYIAPDNISFNEAFAEGRKRALKGTAPEIFEWRGKLYGTELAKKDTIEKPTLKAIANKAKEDKVINEALILTNQEVIAIARTGNIPAYLTEADKSRIVKAIEYMNANRLQKPKVDRSLVAAPQQAIAQYPIRQPGTHKLTQKETWQEQEAKPKVDRNLVASVSSIDVEDGLAKPGTLVPKEKLEETWSEKKKLVDKSLVAKPEKLDIETGFKEPGEYRKLEYIEIKQNKIDKNLVAPIQKPFDNLVKISKELSDKDRQVFVENILSRPITNEEKSKEKAQNKLIDIALEDLAKGEYKWSNGNKEILTKIINPETRYILQEQGEHKTINIVEEGKQLIDSWIHAVARRFNNDPVFRPLPITEAKDDLKIDISTYGTDKEYYDRNKGLSYSSNIFDFTNDSYKFEIIPSYGNKSNFKELDSIHSIPINLFYEPVHISSFTDRIEKSRRRKDHTLEKTPVIALFKNGNIQVGEYKDFVGQDVMLSEGYSIPLNFDYADKIKLKRTSNTIKRKSLVSKVDDREYLLPLSLGREANKLDNISPNDLIKYSGYGNLEGGKVILKAGGKTVYVSGGMANIYNVYREIKDNFGDVTAYIFDAGSYNLPVDIDDGKLTKEKLNSYYRRTEAYTGSGLALKIGFSKSPTESIQNEIYSVEKDILQIEDFIPNKGPVAKGRPDVNDPKFIVLHHTATNDFKSVHKIFTDEKKQASSHYVIDKNGTIYNYVNPKDIAWHAGQSEYKGYENINEHSIGIEFVNTGKVKDQLTQEQLKSATRLLQYLKHVYRINDEDIIDHKIIRENYRKKYGKESALEKIDLMPSEKTRIDSLLQKDNIGFDYKKIPQLEKFVFGGSVSKNKWTIMQEGEEPPKNIPKYMWDMIPEKDKQAYYNNPQAAEQWYNQMLSSKSGYTPIDKTQDKTADYWSKGEQYKRNLKGLANIALHTAKMPLQAGAVAAASQLAGLPVVAETTAGLLGKAALSTVGAMGADYLYNQAGGKFLGDALGVENPVGNFLLNMVSPGAIVGIGSQPFNAARKYRPLKPSGVVDDVATKESIDISAPATKQPWFMQEMPGLHLKSTMSDGAVSKIVEPKTGLINVEQALGIIGKESGGADKVKLVKEALGDNVPLKMNYNQFRKIVQDKLIPLERQFSTKRSNYGVDMLGYVPKIQGNALERFQIFMNTGVSDLNKPRLLESKTLILGNKNKFGRGSSAHGNPEETLGHIHFLRDVETPDVLTVTQIQSDAFQGTHRIMPKVFDKERQLRSLESMEDIAKRQKDMVQNAKQLDANTWQLPDGSKVDKSVIESMKTGQDKINLMKKAEIENFIQKQLLDKNHQERYLQELVDYAGKRGDINKVRVPTSETAAKVQGYKKRTATIEQRKELLEEVEIITKRINKGLSKEELIPANERLEEVNDMLKNSYSKDEQTILKKYSDQPKTIKKLFGKEPKIVTDSKGNTWYEFDIPKKFKEGKGEIKAFQVLPPAAIIGAGALQGKDNNTNRKWTIVE